MSLTSDFNIFPDDEMELLEKGISSISNLFDNDETDINEIHSDPVSYINLMFPDEESLSNIGDVITKLNQKLENRKEEIENQLVNHFSNSELCSDTLTSASLTLKSLFEKINFLDNQAKNSEKIVREVTIDIKRLETAKKNLSNSITALNHLQILSTGVAKLRQLITNSNYFEINQIIGGLIMIEETFKTYQPNSQIDAVLTDLNSIKGELSLKIKTDFNNSCSTVFNDMTSIDPQMMNNLTCIAGNVFKPLDLELIDIFIKYALEEYTDEILSKPENSWLDRLDRRFSLIKRILISYDEVYSLWFPYSWSVDEKLVERFCILTKTSIETVMDARKEEIDAKLYLSSIQKTLSFEEFINDRFKNLESSLNPFEKEISEKPAPLKFSGIISKCFEKYFYIYCDVQDKNLANLIGKFLPIIKSTGNLTTLLLINANDSSTEGSVLSKLTKNSSDKAIESITLVLPCAGELFMYYKKCLMQFSKMGTLSSINKLIIIFKKYLDEFQLKIVEPGIPRILSSRSTTSRDVEKPLSKDDIKSCCCVIATSEYCIETIIQLEQKIREIMGNSNDPQLSFNKIIKSYQSNLQNGVSYLLNILLNLCDSGINTMVKTLWSIHDSVGDQSSYITLIASSLQQIFPMIREFLNSSKSSYDSLCSNFIHSFIPRYITSVYKCRPITDMGIQQLLLDTQVLKKYILTLPTIGSNSSLKADQAYIDYVKEAFKKLEIMLKLVITPHKPYNQFVDTYLNLINDGDTENFQKVLEMKSLKKAEQTLLIESFQVLISLKKTNI